MTGRATSVQSVERAFSILEAMSDAGGEVGLSQLAESLALPVPTLHRLMRTLVAGGYTRQLASRRYALGPRLISLGEAATRAMGSWAWPVLAGLAEALGETANLATLDRDTMTYVAQVQSPHTTTMRVFTEVGRRVPVHSTGVGKAVLATMSESEVRAVVGRAGLAPQTARTIADVDALLAALAQIRHDGYATDDEEQEIGVRCFAVAVPDAPVPTAVSVSGPAARMTDALRDRAVPALLRAAGQLGAVMGPQAAAGAR
jgi:IclR family acetate operon transcriptional repressor